MSDARIPGLLVSVLLAGNAMATTYCVNNGTELRSALITAASNGATDEIRVAIGLYEVNS